MGLDNQPTATLILKDLGAIPAHFRFPHVGHKVERENRGIAAQLDFRVDELIAINPYLPPERFVVAGERIQTVQAAL